MNDDNDDDPQDEPSSTPSLHRRMTMSTNQSAQPTHLKEDHDDNNNAWDVIPPFMSLQPPSTLPSRSNDSGVVNEDLIWKETELQYQRTLS